MIHLRLSWASQCLLIVIDRSLMIASQAVECTPQPETQSLKTDQSQSGDIEMPNSIADVSLNRTARVAGLLYLLIAIFAPFSMVYVPSTLIVPGDATTTA